MQLNDVAGWVQGLRSCQQALAAQLVSTAPGQ